MEVLEKIYITVSFSEAFSEMPPYGKFLKEFLSKKSKIDNNETMALNAECSVVILNKLSSKLKGPGSFLIPCLIGDMSFDRAFCDLGTRVSIMLLYIFRKTWSG